MTLDNILDEIRNAEKIVIVTHEMPDGDAVGSSLGMYHAIKSLGKEIKPKLLDWGDLLKMEGPTMQELCDEFHRRYPDEK